MTYQQRMVTIGTRRHGLKLTAICWNAIELIAAIDGTDWKVWCAKLISDTDINHTAKVREEAMSRLFDLAKRRLL